MPGIFISTGISGLIYLIQINNYMLELISALLLSALAIALAVLVIGVVYENKKSVTKRSCTSQEAENKIDDLETEVKKYGFKSVEEVKATINAVNGEYNVDAADYDAIFKEGYLPWLINIWTEEPKKGNNYAYIAIHHFLERVGVGNMCYSTDMTDAGKHLFDKLKKDGTIEETEGEKDMLRSKYFIVKKDPIEALKKRIDKLPKYLKEKIES